MNNIQLSITCLFSTSSPSSLSSAVDSSNLNRTSSRGKNTSPKQISTYGWGRCMHIKIKSIGTFYTFERGRISLIKPKNIFCRLCSIGTFFMSKAYCYPSFGRDPRFPAPEYPGPIFTVYSFLYYQYLCFHGRTDMFHLSLERPSQ